MLLGARRDLTLKSTADAVACRCVKVLLGPATLTQFEWQGAPPPTAPDTQLVLAFAPEEPCSGGPEGSQGASYWGYRIEGNDVVVLLEPWVKGPPRTVGAVLPRPPSDGQIYVAPVKAGLPFGLPLSGEGTRCALGNPGPKRSSAVYARRDRRALAKARAAHPQGCVLSFGYPFGFILAPQRKLIGATEGTGGWVGGGVVRYSAAPLSITAHARASFKGERREIIKGPARGFSLSARADNSTGFPFMLLALLA